MGRRVYIFEFKMKGSAREAVEQVKERGYGERYAGSGKEVVAVGVRFDSRERRIVEWEVVDIGGAFV